MRKLIWPLIYFHLCSLAWLSVLVVLSWGSWLYELVSLLLGECLLDSWELVGGESLVLVSIDLGFGLNVLLVVMVESGSGISLLTPVIKVKLIVSLLRLRPVGDLPFATALV